MEGLLGVAPLRSIMVSLPAAVEAWRERLTLKADFFRNIRQAPSGWQDACLLLGKGGREVHCLLFV